MSPGDRQEIDERVNVPKAILDWRGGQHKHIWEPALFQRLLKAQRYLRRRIDAVEIAELVRLIQHQHLEAVLGNFVEMKPRGGVGSDHRADFVRLGRDQLLAGRDLRWDVELHLQLISPLRAE